MMKKLSVSFVFVFLLVECICDRGFELDPNSRESFLVVREEIRSNALSSSDRAEGNAARRGVGKPEPPEARSPTKFYVDYKNGTFVKDGKPFRYVSGSLHYSRVPHQYWRDRLTRLSAMGLDAVQTYVPWNYHEPWPGQFEFSGSKDLISFIQMAHSEGLLVLLRIGPYMCGEWDAGGLPAWLLMENPSMAVRTNDATYMAAVERYWGVLLPKIVPYLYENGGPIIMVQIENEYGSFPRRDPDHVHALLNLAKRYLGEDVVYYTTDGNSLSYFGGGRTDGALTTVDFGPVDDPWAFFGDLQDYFRDYRGPYVNSEYYTGWFAHWLEPFQRYSPEELARQLDIFLESNSSSFSVNMYMFLGGTTFGFYPGANSNGNGTNYKSDPNTYDFDSPLTENGGCGVKCGLVRAVILNHTSRVSVPEMPANISSEAYGLIQMEFVDSVLDLKADLATGPPTTSPWPLSFEKLRQDFGFVVYEAIPHQDYTNVTLELIGLADEAVVLVNSLPRGYFSRQREMLEMENFNIMRGDVLSVLVHNMGRVNYGGFTRDFKGVEQVVLGGDLLPHWTMYNLPLNQTGLLTRVKSTEQSEMTFPAFFRARFDLAGTYLDSQSGYLPDTYLKLTSFTRGVAFVNGINLGRFWNDVGPVEALYVPGPFLNKNELNEVIVLELESAACNSGAPDRCYVEFVDQQILIENTLKLDVLYSRIEAAESGQW